MELKRRNKVSADFSMASMTDIIFLLLIFFMITSSAISQSAIDVKLPKADATNPTVQDPVTLSIKSDGKYYLNDMEVPEEQLESNVVKLMEGSTDKGFTVRADAETKHKNVVKAMEIAEKYKYSISIATTQEE